MCNPKHAALEKAKPKPDPAAPPSARNPPHSATYKCKVFGECGESAPAEPDRAMPQVYLPYISPASAEPDRAMSQVCPRHYCPIPIPMRNPNPNPNPDPNPDPQGKAPAAEARRLGEQLHTLEARHRSLEAEVEAVRDSRSEAGARGAREAAAKEAATQACPG